MNDIASLLKVACEQMGCWGAAVLEPHNKEMVLVTKAAYNLPDDWNALTNPIDESTMNGRAYILNKVQVANNLSLSTIRDAPTMHPFYAVMVLPVLVDNKVVGTLEFISDQKDIAFGDKEILFGQSIAKKISAIWEKRY